MVNIKDTEIWKRGDEIINKFHEENTKKQFEQFLRARKQEEKKDG